MYREISPSLELKESIDSFWTYSNNNLSEKFKVLPDACTDLIFDLNHSDSFLSGVMSNYQEIDLKAQSNLIGIRFKSENFGSLSGIPLNETKNLRIELSQIISRFDFNIISQLNGLESINKKINRLENFIASALHENSERKDHLVISVAHRIRLLKGKLNIEELAKFYNIGIRQLQRRFKHYMGLTVKEFSNIIRFKNAERTIKTNTELGFMQIAFNVGYYDHSHMTHEFKRIAGESPSYFR